METHYSWTFRNWLPVTAIQLTSQERNLPWLHFPPVLENSISLSFLNSLWNHLSDLSALPDVVDRSKKGVNDTLIMAHHHRAHQELLTAKKKRQRLGQWRPEEPYLCGVRQSHHLTGRDVAEVCVQSPPCPIWPLALPLLSLWIKRTWRISKGGGPTRGCYLPMCAGNGNKPAHLWALLRADGPDVSI